MSAAISVQIKPNAPRNQIKSITGGVVQVRIAAPPVENKANRELLDYLSDVLDVPKSSLAIVRGHTVRIKVISVAGLTQDEAMRRLYASCSSSGAR